MSFFSNTKLMACMLLAATCAFFAALTHHHGTLQIPPVAKAQDTTDFFAEAEQRREARLEQEAEAEKRAKLQKAKEESVECQFWKQQKNDKSPPRVDEKINQFCNL